MLIRKGYNGHSLKVKFNKRYEASRKAPILLSPNLQMERKPSLRPQ